ncbi:MAG TPA: non-ribosomal peptide synthetase [Verrucomicrobiae bacterium]|nr:non-ribosomal peptide synthetase [Verrucomicrobiae bacterium]
MNETLAIENRPSMARAENGAAKMQKEKIKRQLCAHELFERMAKNNPDAPAVCSGHGSLTYGQLDARANVLAGELRALGVGPETVVALRLRRSVAMLIGALGILKSGGAYLPIDPSEPEARFNFMLDDAGVSVVVTEQSSKEMSIGNNRSVIALNESGQIADGIRSPLRNGVCNHDARNADGSGCINSDNLAYVIYTSGSTGTPKGVEVTHGNLSNLISWHQNAFQVTPRDRASQLARVGFDADVWEIWPYLASGASLHVPDEEIIREPESLQSWLIKNEISITFAPTPMAERLIALRWPANTSLRIMLTGGDTLHVFPPEDLPFLLVNNYGPTECAVVATSGPVSTKPDSNRLPPIGRAISNTQIYLLDDSLDPVPIGTPGEIYIGGANVARGYRNRPELTAERFIPNPFNDNSDRLFKTGDLAEQLPDGQFAFLGRLDEQIKIRGFRIEPNEIIAAMNGHPAISQSIVVARENTPDDRRLVAYFVAANASPPALSELRDFLSTRLPAYMVPSVFVTLKSLPLTPNGKVDRAALPEPDAENTLRDQMIHGPRTEIEKIVAGILAPLLGVEMVDVEANFFSLGGHSLLGIQLISRVRDCLGINLSLRTVFEAPRVVDLSAEIERILRAKLEAMSEDEVLRSLNSEKANLL